MRSDQMIRVLAPRLAVLLALVACTSPQAPEGPDTPSPTSSESPQPSPTPTPTPAPTPTTSTPDPGPTSLPPDLVGSDWERIPTAADVVALTFDGGASNAAVASILGTLAGKGVEATFFVTGDSARRYPQDVAAIAAAGHRLGNHSDTHAHYPQLRDVEIAADLGRAEEAIAAASGGAQARPLFRFPYGDRTDADVRAVNAAGYVPVRWTVDTLGWRGTSGGVSTDEVVDRVIDTATPGQIVLMHLGAHPQDGSTLDADALPAIIDELRGRGYSFVTLDTLLT
jgi:peptidoglycan/xylan/chitin deacetylase (PgdA/CDA1 family)